MTEFIYEKPGRTGQYSHRLTPCRIASISLAIDRKKGFALGDECVKRGPEVSLALMASLHARARKHLTGTASCPDGPSGKVLKMDARTVKSRYREVLNLLWMTG